MSDPKYCVDCIHHRPSKNDPNGELDRCAATPLLYRRNLVTGLPRAMSFCDMQRGADWFEARLFGKCGASARFFKAK